MTRDNKNKISNKSFHVLDELLEKENPSLKKDFKRLMDLACESYNSLLSLKNKRTAITAFDLLCKLNQEKIKELFGYNKDVLSFALCVHSANYKKYFKALQFYWYVDDQGVDVWRKPETGSIMKTTTPLQTSNGILKIKAKVKLLDYVPKNSLEAYVEVVSTGEKIKCYCRDIRQKHER